MDRFWEKVDKSGDCWEWIGAIDPCGYGRINVNGINRQAHRIAIILDGIDIPSGMEVCHSCDNPACVNPDHLWIGNHADNMNDMTKKGRAAPCRGESNGRAKLSIKDVCDIRASNETHTAQAAKYNVAISTVSRIRSRRLWS